MEQTKEEIKETKVDETAVQPKEKKGLNLKILLFGIPIFIVQLIAVYFITANFLLNRVQVNHSAAEPAQTETKKEAAQPQANSKELGKFVYMVEEILVNPAKTDGKRYLLSSLGFDVPSEKDNQELKAKEVLLKDAVISVMSSKEMSQLGNIAYRDTLRTEIIKRLAQVMPNVKINTIYFSKYILQ